MMGGGAAGLGALAMLPSASAFSINSDNPLSFDNPDQSGTEFEVSPSGDITSLNSFNTGNPVQFQDQIQPQNDIKDDQDVTVYDRSNKTIGDGTTQANHQSINTDRLRNDAPEITIPAEYASDAQTIIENAPAGSQIVVEPATEYPIESPPLTIPKAVSIHSSGVSYETYLKGATGAEEVDPADLAVFKKMGDGDIATVASDTTLAGITFDCNKANYTGGGVKDRHHYVQFVQMFGCQILESAGDGRVVDGGNKQTYLNTTISSHDGWGMRMTVDGTFDSGNSSAVHHTRYFNGEIGQNGSGGVLYELPNGGNGPWDERFRTRIQQNSGPGIKIGGGTTDFVIKTSEFVVTSTGCGGPFIEFDGCGVQKTRFAGEVEDADGPALYVNSPNIQFRELIWDMNTKNCLQSPSKPTNSPFGTLHFDDYNTVHMVSNEALFLGSAHSDASLISAQDGSNNVFWVINGAMNDANDSMDGRVIPRMGDHAMNGTVMNNGRGRQPYADYPASRVIDHWNDTEFFEGILSSRPSPNKSTAAYVDDGTGSNSAGVYLTTDGGSTWTAL